MSVANPFETIIESYAVLAKAYRQQAQSWAGISSKEKQRCEHNARQFEAALRDYATRIELNATVPSYDPINSASVYLTPIKAMDLRAH